MPNRAATFLISLALLSGGCLNGGGGSSTTDPVDDPTPPDDETPPLVMGPGGPCPEGAERARILQLVNDARSEPRQCGATVHRPVAPLAWNCLLEEAALGHSIDMGDVNFFSHTGSDGLGPDARVTAVGYEWVALGENISAGRESAEETIQGWLDSPGHCANIMNESFTEMGLAYYRPVGSDYRIYWTQKLARPR